MGECSWVDHDPQRARRLLLKKVDQLTFVVALEHAHLDPELSRFCAESLDEIGVRTRAVDVWLAFPEQVQIWTVDDDYAFHASALRRTRRTISEGTAWPGSAWPRRRGITHATFPRRAFLSRGIAASTFARSTLGALSGRP